MPDRYPDFSAFWQAANDALLQSAEHAKQRESGFIMLDDAHVRIASYWLGQMGRPPVEEKEKPLRACFQKGKPCSTCACRLYRLLGEYQVCARCFPSRDYHRYANLIEELYPQKRASIRLVKREPALAGQE